MGPAATHDLDKPLYPSFCQPLHCSPSRQSLGWRGGTSHLLKPDTFLIAFPKQPLKQVYCTSSRKLRLENGHRRESGYHTGSLASLKNPLRMEALCEPLRGLLQCWENEKTEISVRPKPLWEVSSVTAHSHHFNTSNSHFTRWLSFFCSAQGSLALT